MLPFLKEYVSDLFSNFLENSHFYSSFPFENCGFFFFLIVWLRLEGSTFVQFRMNADWITKATPLKVFI